MKKLKFAIIATSMIIFTASCDQAASTDQKNNAEKGKDTVKQSEKVVVIDSATSEIIDSTHKK